MISSQRRRVDFPCPCLKKLYAREKARPSLRRAAILEIITGVALWLINPSGVSHSGVSSSRGVSHSGVS